MRPLSLLLGRLLEERARRYADGRAASFTLSRPVLSVGNLTVGGTGKTPVVLHLAERFLAQGRRPAILSRGYGRASREVVVVSSGEGARVGPDSGGDEPVLLAKRLPGAIVVVAPRRVDAARAAEAFHPDLFLLDDGFQHLSVRRDLEVLLLDAADPFGGGRYPPFGRLREPLSALRRADAIVFTRAAPGRPTEETLETVARWNPDARVFNARIRPAGLRNPLGAADRPPPGTDFLAVCGIARPDSFREGLAELGLSPVQTLAFPDHCRYGGADLARIARAAARSGSMAIVTTEKDAVKLDGRVALSLFAVRLEVELSDPGFFAWISGRLSGAEAVGRGGGA
jgi:tetraacyldisaccharide 4'-kinase